MDALAALCHCALTLGLGATYQESPPGGTWWQPDAPAHFSHVSPEVALGLRGENWSVELADMGWQRSAAIAGVEPYCPADPTTCAHWYGRQNPRGVWAAWEPALFGALRGRIGLGIVNPHFTMDIPDWKYSDNIGRGTPTSITVDSTRWSPSWVAGFVYRMTPVDVLVDYRSVAPIGANDTPGNFHALSRAAYTVSLRFSL